MYVDEIRRYSVRDDRREVDWYYRTYLGEFREVTLDPSLPEVRYCIVGRM